MRVFCEVDDAVYTYEIQISPTNDEFNLDQSTLLRSILSISSSLDDIYKNAIDKSGQILGQVRIRMLESLDKLFTYLILLNESLKENIDKKNTDLNNAADFKTSFNLNNKKITSKGVLHEIDIKNINSFESAYQEFIILNLKNILLNFKKLNNNNIDSLMTIFKLLDNIFYQLLIIRYKLKNCLINK